MRSEAEADIQQTIEILDEENRKPQERVPRRPTLPAVLEAEVPANRQEVQRRETDLSCVGECLLIFPLFSRFTVSFFLVFSISYSTRGSPESMSRV